MNLKRLFPFLIITTIGTTTAAIVVPIIIKKKAENILKNFIEFGGPENNLSSDKKLNYVALGDSITSGYNGHYSIGEGTNEYISYADFLAKNLQKTNKLKSYKNYGQSRHTIYDFNELILNPSVLNQLQKADLITISISSNDLLKGAKFFGLPFGLSLDTILGKFLKNPSLYRETLFKDVYSSTSKKDIEKILNDLLSNFSKTLYERKEDGKLKMQHIISYHPELIDPIINIIKRDLMTLTIDIHKMAPKAKIKFILPANPFSGFPDSFMNYVPSNGKSLFNIFSDFKTAFKKAFSSANYVDVLEFQDGFNWYVNFLDNSNFKNKKQIINNQNINNDDDKKKLIKRLDVFIEHAKRWKEYKKISKTREQFYADFFMNNLADIHPSVFGHEAFGNYVFNSIAKEIKVENPENIYTVSYPQSLSAKDRIQEIDRIDTSEENPLGEKFDPSKLANKKSNNLATKISSMIRKIINNDNKESPLIDIISVVKSQNKLEEKIVKYKINPKNGEWESLSKENDESTKEITDFFKKYLNNMISNHPIGHKIANILNQELIFGKKTSITKIKELLFGDKGIIENYSYKKTISLEKIKDIFKKNIEEIFITNNLKGIILNDDQTLDKSNSFVDSNEKINLSLSQNELVSEINEHNKKATQKNSPYKIINIKNVGDLISLIKKSFYKAIFKDAKNTILKEFKELTAAQGMLIAAKETFMSEEYIKKLKYYIDNFGKSSQKNINNSFAPSDGFEELFKNILKHDNS